MTEGLQFLSLSLFFFFVCKVHEREGFFGWVGGWWGRDKDQEHEVAGLHTFSPQPCASVDQ